MSLIQATAPLQLPHWKSTRLDSLMLALIRSRIVVDSRRVRLPPTSMLVAVVEDHEGLRVALGRLLSAAGHDVSLFESAEAYLAAPPAEPGCLLLDIHLPGMSGPDLIREVRTTTNGSSPLIILTTADRSLEGHARDLGCNGLLTKPIDSTLLLTTIDWLVARSRGDR